MPFNELMRSAVREAQIMDEHEAAHEPRQAFVTRTEGNGVWVRFGTEDVTAPESWFVSTVSGVPPGTMGWVYPLAGGKGLFVVTNIFVPQTDSAAYNQSFTLSSSGQEIGNTGVTFSGLDPNVTYTLQMTTTVKYSNTSVGRHRIAQRIVGNTTTDTTGGTYNTTQVVDTGNVRINSQTAQPDRNGVIVVYPSAVWVSGLVSINTFSIMVTIS